MLTSRTHGSALPPPAARLLFSVTHTHGCVAPPASSPSAMFAHLRFALRQLARSPGYTAVAVVTLALGIGLSTSSFSIANVVLLRDLAYPDATRLVRVMRTARQSGFLPHAPANLIDVRDTAESFSGMALYTVLATTLGEAGQPAESIGTVSATANLFDVLQVKPFIGRGFLPGDDAPNRPLVTVLTYKTWSQRYGADPHVIGRTVRLEAKTHTIVGVLPPEFDAPLVWGSAAFVTPFTITPDVRQRRNGAFLHAVARLADGVTVVQVQSELTTIAARLAR